MQSAMWEQRLAGIMPYVVEMRHELHRNPEISGREFETKNRILREIRKYSRITVSEYEGCCSLTATLQNGEGPCIAIRADMDALPMQEETGLPFASSCPGVMHACGHDTHMALALGSMRWFAENRSLWHGTMKWLFESQEETVGGGKQMVAQGCMENPRVNYVVGQHVNPNYPAGVFFCKTGYVSGASDELHLTIRGKSCHGAYPEKGVDAIVVTASVVSALQSLVSRTVSPLDSAVITLGKIQGGKAGNVVCDEVKLDGTIRTLKDTTRYALHDRIRKLACGIAEGMGGSAEVSIVPGYGAVYNDDEAYAKIEDTARKLLGGDQIVIREMPSLGVESICFFMQDTPGVYWDVGSGISTALHTPTMMIDESFLLPALALQCAGALSLMGQEQI